MCAGGLVGLAALLIPGIGPFIALGALGAVLTGAVTGAVVGGITAALVDFSGIPEDDARAYETMVMQGKTLVAVKARDEDSPEVYRILTSAGAQSVRDEQTTSTGGTKGPVVAIYDEGGNRIGRSTGGNPFTDAAPIEDTSQVPSATKADDLDPTKL